MKQLVLELEGVDECSTLSGKGTGSTKESLFSAGGWRAQPLTPCIGILLKEEYSRRSKFLPLLLLPF